MEASSLRRPKVLVIGPFAATAGGVVTFHRNLCEVSDLKERWTLVPFSTSRPPKGAVDENYSYGAIFNSGFKRLAKGVAISAFNLFRFPWAARGADIAQIQSSDFYSFWEAMLYAHYARFLRIPVVMRFGGSFDLFYEGSSPRVRSLIDRAMDCPTSFVVQSEGWKEIFSQHVDASRLNVVNNAVPMPPPVPERSARTESVQALFVCTSDARRKGAYTVLDAVPRLRGAVKITFVAAGKAIREEVEQRDLGDVIQFEPVQTRQEMTLLYRRADLLLMPSVSEGFPNTLLEAMAAGLPVVATAVAAIPEVIESGTHGYLIEPGDDDALVENTLKLVEDPDLRHRLGRAAHQRVSDAFEINHMFGRFDQIWSAAQSTD